MKVYVIEDASLKSARLVKFLSERMPDAVVEVFASFQSGLRAIELSVPDLLLLDMTIPTFDRIPGGREGRLRPLGGYDLMRKLALRQINLKTIVVTQLESFGEGEDKETYAEMIARCGREFPDTFLGGVYFRLEESTWESELESLLAAFKVGRAR